MKLSLVLLLVLFWMGPFASAKEISPFVFSSNAPHTLQVLPGGTLALKTYVEMVRQAKKSIELESYVFNPDGVGQIVLEALIEKAKAGVHVRMLLDHEGSFKHFTPAVTNAILDAGIKLRFFNASPLRPLPRNHRKFLIIDEDFVFSGGRNISIDNFNLNTVFNRFDYSMTLRGPIAKDVLRSFETYWKHPYVISAKKTEAAAHFECLSSCEIYKKKLAEIVDAKIPSFHVPRVDFVSDEPSNKNRIFLREYLHRLQSVEKSLILESPTFSMGKHTSHAIAELLKNKKQVRIFTNVSQRIFQPMNLLKFKSNEQHLQKMILTFKLLGPDIREMDMYDLGAEVFLQKDASSTEVLPILYPSLLSKASWNTHCKLSIFDASSVLISSYNFDILSEYYNGEAGFYFEQVPELAQYFQSLELAREYYKYSGNMATSYILPSDQKKALE